MGRVSGGNHKRSGGVFHEVGETRPAPVCFNLYIYFAQLDSLLPFHSFFFSFFFIYIFFHRRALRKNELLIFLGGGSCFSFYRVESSLMSWWNFLLRILVNCDLFLELLKFLFMWYWYWNKENKEIRRMMVNWSKLRKHLFDFEKNLFKLVNIFVKNSLLFL